MCNDAADTIFWIFIIIGAIEQVSESNCKLLIQEHIQKQGQLKGVCSLKMLLCGLPEAGKTTTMLQFTNNLCCTDPDDLQLPSTVLGKPRNIQLRHMLIGDDKIWNFEENVEKLGQSIYSLILNPSHTTSAATITSAARTTSAAMATSSATTTSAAMTTIVLPQPLVLLQPLVLPRPLVLL